MCSLTEQRESWIIGKVDKLGKLTLPNYGKASGSGDTAGNINQPEGFFRETREES